MPEKQKQSETCIVIYAISQGNVATRFRSSGTFAYDFITIYCLVCFGGIFLQYQLSSTNPFCHDVFLVDGYAYSRSFCGVSVWPL